MVRAKDIPAVDVMASNILAIYHEGLNLYPTAVYDGTLWYHGANRDARDIATIADITLTQSADIISILCPQKAWPDNVRDARAVVSQFRDIGTCDRATIRQWMPNNVGQFSNDRQFAECRDALLGSVRVTGRKRIDFADSIIDPEACLDRPVVDQHACRIAIAMPDDPGTFPETRYDQFATAYRLAAEIAKIAPQHMQAITWCVWRMIPRRSNGRMHHAVARENVTRATDPPTR